MLRNFLVSLVIFFMFSGFTAKQFRNDKPTVAVEYDTSNTVFMRSEVNSNSVSKAIDQIERAKSDEVYLFISSPGGSVIDGMVLVNYIRSTEKKVICVADVAISMAFVILQACDERLTTANSITMQHHTSFGARGGESPNVKSFVDFFLKMEDTMDAIQAKRIGISTDKFKKMIDRDWWLFGDDVVKAGVSDRMVTSTCSKKALEGEYEEKISNMMYNVTLTWSMCPHILEPRAVQISNSSYVSPTLAQQKEVLDQILARRFVAKMLNLN